MKAKMKFKYVLMACAALVLGATSCSKEDNGEVNKPVDAEEAYVSFKVKQLNRGVTRAVAPYDATKEEMAVYTSKVYVFNSNKVLQQIVDLDVNTANTGAEKIFKTTVGVHYFLAVANQPVIPVALGTSLDNIVEVIENLNLTKFSTYLDPCDGDGKFTAKTGTGFFMTSGVNTKEGSNTWYKTIDYWEQEIVATKDPANPPTKVDDIIPENRVVVPIGRAMAKANVVIQSSKYTVKNSANDVLGKIESPKYALANNPDKMYYFPFFGTLQRFQTPLYNRYDKVTAPKNYWPALHAADFGDVTVYGAHVTPNTANKNNAAFGYRDVPSTLVNDMNDAELAKSTFYIMENSNEVPTYGNSTIAQVQTTFVPDAGAWEDAGTPAADGTFYRIWYQADPLTGDGKFETKTKQGFWTSRDAIYAAYISDLTGLDTQAKKDAKLAESGHYINTYTKGQCWYLIPLRNTYLQPNDPDPQRHNDPIVYSVMRNHFYDITVNSITDCGYPGPGGKNPEDPTNPPGPGDETEPIDPLDPEGTPYIHVSIEVKQWVRVPQGEDLGIRD